MSLLLCTVMEDTGGIQCSLSHSLLEAIMIVCIEFFQQQHHTQSDYNMEGITSLTTAEEF